MKELNDELLILYKWEQGELYYLQIWDVSNRMANIHTGLVGNEGTYLEIKAPWYQSYKAVKELYIQSKFNEGFEDFGENQFQYTLLRLEYECDSVEYIADIGKNLSEYLGHKLLEIGLGFNDEVNIYQSLISIEFATVDFNMSKSTIEEAMQNSEYQGHYEILELMVPLDTEKRNVLIKKYEQNDVLVTVDEFFEGNTDNASIAPNIWPKSSLYNYHRVLKSLLLLQNVEDVFVELYEVILDEAGAVVDGYWPYAEVIYVIGTITENELNNEIHSLKPSEIWLATEQELDPFGYKFKGKRVLKIWWD